MNTTLEQRLLDLADRGMHLLDQLERRYADAAEPDWSAPAFMWRSEGQLMAVHNPHWIALDELRCVESQKQQLSRNTRQFLAGAPANNALLWGTRGTGKSSLVKALLTRFYDQGLRLVQVDAHELEDLPAIVAPLAGRDERFILFADDLSFEAGDASYKTLKAALDGSVAAMPDNVIVYATSNRRHLLPEYQQDNRDARNIDGEVHHGEAVEERISLSERFGLWLSFYPFDQAAYLDIVHGHLARLGVENSASEEINRAALQWALARGSRSGRVAWQFARDWAGRQQIA